MFLCVLICKGPIENQPYCCKDVDIFATDKLNREWNSWAHNLV